MHPVKAARGIRESYALGITSFVVDHPDELAKILINTLPHKPVIIIRLALAHEAQGCIADHAVTLAKAASAEGLAVGFSFHVGTQCLEPAAYFKALEQVGKVIHAANIHPEVIVADGGFPVAGQPIPVPPLQDYVKVIQDGMAQIRLDHPSRLLASSGHALVASGASLIVKVELRQGDRLYLNDGVYGGMHALRAGHHAIPMRAWRINGSATLLTSSAEDFRFYGPASDNVDIMQGPFSLPSDIRAGDYIECGHMGAYSLGLRSDSHGFHHAHIAILRDSAF